MGEGRGAVGTRGGVVVGGRGQGEGARWQRGMEKGEESTAGEEV